ncbi:hypothetical protein Tco_0982187 [Tanacetum coccineum]
MFGGAGSNAYSPIAFSGAKMVVVGMVLLSDTTQTGSYQLVLSFRALVERASDLGFQKKSVHEIKGSLDADEDIGVDEVSSVIDGVFDIGGGEVLGVDEDESNKVSILKDVGGEFDDCLDEINLGLSEEFMIRVLEDKDVFGESLVVF